MADKRISELPTLPAALVGDEPFPMVQSANTYRATARDVSKVGYQSVVTDASGARTLSVGDRGAWLRFTNATATILTIPTNASVGFAVGETFNGIQGAAGKVTIVGAGGVTVNIPTDYKNNTRALGAPLCLIKVATDTWDLIGDMEAA